jgi:hypothetical protein
MVLPGLPPVQVRITFPTSSASPSAWRIGSGLELTLHVGAWAEALNDINAKSPATADMREIIPVIVIILCFVLETSHRGCTPASGKWALEIIISLVLDVSICRGKQFAGCLNVFDSA